MERRQRGMEWLFRIAGALLVIGSTVWTGVFFAAKEKYRLKELEKMEQGILLLEGQITYLSAPLPEVLESVGWKTDGAVGDAFRQAAGRMARREGISAEAIWKEIWQEKQKETYLRPEDMDALFLFGKTLGYLDKEQQKNSIRLFLRYLEGAQEKGRRRLDKNGRLYYGIGVLSGLLLVTVLL